MTHKHPKKITQPRYATVASLAGAAGKLTKPVAWTTMRQVAGEERSGVLNIVSASQARRNFGEVLRRVYERGEVQIIERAGTPVAAIVSLSELARLYSGKVRKLSLSASSEKPQP